MFKHLWITIFFLTFNSSSFADNEDINNEIANNVSMEYITCGSFFAITSGALEKAGDINEAKDFKQAMDAAFKFALLSATAGRTEEKAQEVTLARFEMILNQMKETMDADYSNISLLLNKHGKRCQWIMQNTDEFLEEWKSKIHKKHGLIK